MRPTLIHQSKKKEFWEEKLLEFDYGLLEGHEYLVTSFPY
jgi:hypothetical protein